MRRRWTRIFAGLLAAMTLCTCAPLAGADPPEEMPMIDAFFYLRSGMSTYEARSYEVKENGRGCFVWIELHHTHHIVLPMTDADREALSALVAELALSEWDGFDQTDPDVLDGSSFSLDAAFEDGSTLTAHGSNSFPEGYSEKAARMEDFFKALMATYEIDVEE